MRRREYLEAISFMGLRKWLFVHALQAKTVARECGILYTTLKDILNGTRIPYAGTVVKLCSVLGCMPGDIMEFKDIRHRKIEVIRETFPRGCVQSYEPLRRWLETCYPGRRFSECMALVDHFDPEEHIEGRRIVGGIVGEGSRKGLFAEQTASLNNDRDVSVRLLYNVSKAFRLPVDMILGYRNATEGNAQENQEDLLVCSVLQDP